MLTRIRNANQALHEKVSMPTSKFKEEIARILAAEGYIDGYEDCWVPVPPHSR
jgi:small subunit ribosomal protein S8